MKYLKREKKSSGRKILSLVSASLCLSFLLSACGTVNNKTSAEISKDGVGNVVVLYDDSETSFSDICGAIAGTLAKEENIDRPKVRKISDYSDDGKATVSLIKGENYKYRDYTIKPVDNGIEIAAGSQYAADRAANAFINRYDEIITGGRVNVNFSLEFFDEYEFSDFKITGEDISDFNIVYANKKGTNPSSIAADILKLRIEKKCGISLPVTDDETRQGKSIILNNGGDTYSYEMNVDSGKVEITAGGIYAFSSAINTLLATGGESGNYKEDDVFKEYENEDFVYAGEEKAVDKITISGNDISDYIIVYHDYGEDYTGYGESEVYAAQELQKYIEYICGNKLESVKDSDFTGGKYIAVGKIEIAGLAYPDTSECGDEGVIIKADGDNLILTGGEKRGALYAVYTLLEDYMGCRFLSPGCEITYKNQEIDIPSDISVNEKSSFFFRDIEERHALDADYSAKRKINGYYHRDLTFQLGGSVEFVRGGNALVHTMSTIFRLSDAGSQPCLTDESVYADALEKVRANLKINHDSPILSFTQNDNNNYCSCKNCRAVNEEEGSNAGTLIRFVNRLADDIKDDYPNVKILTLAYMYSSEPTKTKPRDNVIIQYCSLDACNGDSLDSITCKTNRSIYSQFTGWRELTDNLYFWLYTTSFNGESRSKVPYMNFDALYDNYKCFREYGVTGIFNEGDIREETYEFGALRSYLISRLMWEEDMTFSEYEKYTGEFIKGYYGQAADVILLYYDLLETCSEGKHFAWYAATSGVLETTLLASNSKEISDWWTKILNINYRDRDVSERCRELYTGYKYISGN